MGFFPGSFSTLLRKPLLSSQIGAASQPGHSISMPFYSSSVTNASGKKQYLCLYNCKCISQVGFLLSYLTWQLFPKQLKIAFYSNQI